MGSLESPVIGDSAHILELEHLAEICVLL